MKHETDPIQAVGGLQGLFLLQGSRQVYRPKVSVSGSRSSSSRQILTVQNRLDSADLSYAMSVTATQSPAVSMAYALLGRRGPTSLGYKPGRFIQDQDRLVKVEHVVSSKDGNSLGGQPTGHIRAAGKVWDSQESNAEPAKRFSCLAPLYQLAVE